jgi:hypothetical protein
MICSGEVLLLLYYSKKEYACESGGERLPLRFLHLFGVKAEGGYLPRRLPRLKGPSRDPSARETKQEPTSPTRT